MAPISGGFLIPYFTSYTLPYLILRLVKTPLFSSQIKAWEAWAVVMLKASVKSLTVVPYLKFLKKSKFSVISVIMSLAVNFFISFPFFCSFFLTNPSIHHATLFVKRFVKTHFFSF